MVEEKMTKKLAEALYYIGVGEKDRAASIIAGIIGKERVVTVQRKVKAELERMAESGRISEIERRYPTVADLDRAIESARDAVKDQEKRARELKDTLSMLRQYPGDLGKVRLKSRINELAKILGLEGYNVGEDLRRRLYVSDIKGKAKEQKEALLLVRYYVEGDKVIEGMERSLNANIKSSESNKIHLSVLEDELRRREAK